MERLILRWILRKWDRGMDWIDLAQDWDRWVIKSRRMRWAGHLACIGRGNGIKF
jgi:hypothetical protein